LTEFAIALPVLVLLLLALIQFGVVFSHYVNLTDAVRVAGRALTTCRFGGDATAKGNLAAGGLTIKWDNGTNPLIPPAGPGCGGATAGTQLTIRGNVEHEKLNILLFGLAPSFADITLTSKVTVTEE
jgi:Flp pilus assembly protein TadG